MHVINRLSKKTIDDLFAKIEKDYQVKTTTEFDYKNIAVVVWGVVKSSALTISWLLHSIAIIEIKSLIKYCEIKLTNEGFFSF